MHNQYVASESRGNRRALADRRVTESGPPLGEGERRIFAEKRQPEVVESSFEEWEALMMKNFP